MTHAALLLAMAAVLHASAAWAQSKPGGVHQFLPARPLAVGGSGRALATGNEAIYMNPAGMSGGIKYTLEGQYKVDPKNSLHEFGVSIIDSRTWGGPGVGLGFVYTTGDTVYGRGPMKGYRVDGAVSFPLGDMFMLGLSGKLLSYNLGGREGAIFDGTMDAGALARINEWISVAVTGHNLIWMGKGKFPIQMSEAMSVGLGMPFAITADVIQDFTSRDNVTLLAGGGAEYVIAEFFPIRAGYQYDGVLDNHFVSGGFGLHSEVVGLDVTYRHNLSVTSDFMIAAGLVGRIP